MYCYPGFSFLSTVFISCDLTNPWFIIFKRVLCNKQRHFVSLCFFFYTGTEWKHFFHVMLEKMASKRLAWGGDWPPEGSENTPWLPCWLTLLHFTLFCTILHGFSNILTTAFKHSFREDKHCYNTWREYDLEIILKWEGVLIMVASGDSILPKT